MEEGESFGCAEIEINRIKGNEDSHAEKENLQYDGNHTTRSSDWFTRSFIFADLER